jgi:uncharacterized alpha-E superfamily protein
MATDKKVKVTVIPAGSDPNDPFNQVATYYIIHDDHDDKTLPTEFSLEMREVLSRPTTSPLVREAFVKMLAENKLKMRARELRAKLTPEEWVELAEIERKLDEIKK